MSTIEVKHQNLFKSISANLGCLSYSTVYHYKDQVSLLALQFENQVLVLKKSLKS